MTSVVTVLGAVPLRSRKETSYPAGIEVNDQFDHRQVMQFCRSIFIDLQNNAVQRNSAQRSNSLDQHQQQVVTKC